MNDDFNLSEKDDDQKLANDDERETENEEDRNQKVRDAFQLLTQGVDVVHHEPCIGNRKGQKFKKTMWMDPDILRLCVDVSRPSLKDKARGKIPPGVYIRDVAAARKGFDSFDFQSSIVPPTNSGTCLSLIATERTICLELQSQKARDWFWERFELVILDVLTDDEKALRSKRQAGGGSNVYFDRTVSDQMQSLLERGLQVLHHHPQGKIQKAFILFDVPNDRIEVHSSERSMFGFSTKPMSLKLSDIVEIRPGTHSIGFVRTNSTDKFLDCMSIIGSECTLDLQLATNKARDLFVTKLRVFVLRGRPENFAASSTNNQDVS